jgi:hypothetical protein
VSIQTCYFVTSSQKQHFTKGTLIDLTRGLGFNLATASALLCFSARLKDKKTRRGIAWTIAGGTFQQDQREDNSHSVFLIPPNTHTVCAAEGLTWAYFCYRDREAPVWKPSFAGFSIAVLTGFVVAFGRHVYN